MAIMDALSTQGNPLLWTSKLSSTPDKFTLDLDGTDCDEIKAALVHLKTGQLSFHDISPANFPLPKLQSRLTENCMELHTGKGFFIIKGLDIGPCSDEDLTAIYLGLASYMGDERGIQNKEGDVMIHVVDAKHWTVPRDQRHGIHSQKSLPFHNDMGSDILSLQARECAETGGSTYLASALSIYQDLADKQPEVLEPLSSENWPIQVSGTDKYILAPLMQVHDGKLVTNVDPARLGPHPDSITKKRDNGVPKLSEKQEAALIALDAFAKKNEIGVSLQKGDILFLNNWAILHRRDSYKDGQATSRHLVRLWTRNSKLGWAIPEDMAVPWKAAFERDIEKVYKIKPPKEYVKPNYTAGSAAFAIDDIEGEKA